MVAALSHAKAGSRALAAARKAQIEHLHQVGRGPAEKISALLTAERICDAAADGELADLGLSQKAALALVARAMAALTDDDDRRHPRGRERGVGSSV